MPLLKPEDHANNDINKDVCLYCADENGNIKSCEDIFEGGVEYFMNATGSSREKAERLTVKNMKSLPYWKDKNCECLKKEEATEEEFKEVFNKM